MLPWAVRFRSGFLDEEPRLSGPTRAHFSSSIDCRVALTLGASGRFGPETRRLHGMPQLSM